MHDEGRVVGHPAAVVHAMVLPEEVHGKLPPVTVTVAQQTGVADPHPEGESQGGPASPETPLLEPELEAEPLLEPELDPLLEPELEVEPPLEPELEPLLPPDPELDPDEDPELELELESAPESEPPLPPVLLLLLLHDVASKNGQRVNAMTGVNALRMARTPLHHGTLMSVTTRDNVPSMYRRGRDRSSRAGRLLASTLGAGAPSVPYGTSVAASANMGVHRGGSGEVNAGSVRIRDTSFRLRPALRASRRAPCRSCRRGPRGGPADRLEHTSA